MDDVNLYYFPGSYYSLKVILALLEKGIPYKGHIVNIHGGDQSHEWFLRLNPKGEVPVMKVGDTVYPESEHIIDVIDEMLKCGPKLVPEVDDRLGSEVRETRKLLHDLPIDVITFGVLANRKFQTSDNLFPQALQSHSRFTREGIDTQFSATISEYRKQIQTCSSDVRTSVEEIVSGEGHWLFGPEMTAADVTLICLLIRLQMIGILSRYVNQEVRPELLRYFNRLETRATIIKLNEIMASVKYVYMKRAIKT
ncbi:ganglioside-induced differentiation-associated protein 1-like isoform X2 [Dreissena polymorpha]|uniref:ganglioside-induced differentiation-associated protein 1-like isoform X2 n=1 Tax=Dreissena polymorpha TaxID=45954 RepID=UPI002264A273|nr:ganglioside-induced differentiation-associated protein 1-like isoform X2 [Dreissena polymorpha]